MRFAPAIVVIAASLAATQAQTRPGDCSQRTAQDYVATTRTERLADYLRSLGGPRAFLYAGTLAGIDQAADRPREWGRDAQGYPPRFGTVFAENIIGATTQDGLALALDEDNRYFASGARGFWRRVGYAVTSPLLARHSDTSRSFSVSTVAGVGAGAAIVQIWQPRSTSHWSNAARSFGLTFGFRAGIDLFREFTPRRVGAFVE